MTVAGAEDGAKPEGLRVDGGGLGACSQRIWLGVTGCEDVTDHRAHLYGAFRCAQFCVK